MLVGEVSGLQILFAPGFFRAFLQAVPISIAFCTQLGFKDPGHRRPDAESGCAYGSHGPNLGPGAFWVVDRKI